ncbi:unnamed protein product [Amoebophrya sp. A120]|nr:unnamed protein product [Amoebophrya sp. A120]|eukprot:GSA120T00003718001.1
MAMVNIPSTNTDPSYRYKMPKLISKVEGRGNGIKTSVVNCKEIATAIKRPPGYIMKWFSCEQNATSTYTEKDGEGQRAILLGAHQAPDLQVSLDKFLSVYVLCPTCGLPEMDLKTNKKAEEISGACAACGWSGLLQDATIHRMAAFVFKNPMDGGGDDSKQKGKTKEERRAARAKKAAEGNKEDAGDAEAKKKKKKKAADSDADEDNSDSGETKKKKKKDKKEKKEKKKKTREESDDGGDQDGTRAKSSDDEENQHKDEDTLTFIDSLKGLKEGGAKEFIEESRLLKISRQMEKKLFAYAILESLFPDESLSAKAMEKAEDLFAGVVREDKIPMKDLMWAFELYISEHEACLKGFPMVLKAMYDMDLIEEENFLPYYNDPKANKNHPGHDAVHKIVKPFAEWLAENSDSDDSD